jgi:hypothetical protein
MNDDAPFSISIRQNGEVLRAFVSLTRNVAQDYLQELVNAGLPVKDIDFGNGFDIAVTIPSAPHLFIKWIVEGGPLKDAP